MREKIIQKILAGAFFYCAGIYPVLAENAFIAKYHSEENEKVLQSEGDKAIAETTKFILDEFSKKNLCFSATDFKK